MMETIFGYFMERIAKILSLRGICSRRVADAMIANGQVVVDGSVAVLGQKADLDCEIELLDAAQKKIDETLTIILNKPLGYISHLPQENQKEAKLLLTPERNFQNKKIHVPVEDLSVVGRLDINSSGLMIFSNDGPLIKKIIGEDTDVEKEYLVRIEGEITPNKIKQLRFGLMIEGRKLKRAQVDILAEDLLRVVLKEGMKRQIRKMCRLVDLEVVKLKRVRIGQIRLGKLPLGMWQVLPKNFIV